MSDIFISYTSSDRNWAFWIAHEVEALGHVVHIHEWEISGGGNIMAWMEERHDAADHILCIVSKAYLKQPYSSLERQAAQWAAASERPGFTLPVFIENCKPPTLLAHLKRCDLYGLTEEAARERLKNFLAPAEKPPRRPVFPAFPGSSGTAKTTAPTRPPPPFPGKVALSNIPISVPRHFVGRDDALEAIATVLADTRGPVAITALHGLRGVGKTTLAAAYAEKHRGDYRATWWIRAQTPDGMRADLVALGVRLGWVAADEKEEPALATVLDRLRQEGDGILLIFDNATDAEGLRSYLPRGGTARVLVTSNAHAWRGIADPVEIRVWPKETGADYLIARTGRTAERAPAEALSEALGGLPLAHEQAAAYCERLEVPLAEYHRRFETTPQRLLDDARDAPRDYHDRTTVAKTFALAIDEATKIHPAAEPLIVYASLLAPEPIPLFLFAEAREKFGEPLASALGGDGIDEVVAALRVFALVDHESIADERDSAITTHCIRLHRLVRQVAQARRRGEAIETTRRILIETVGAVYPLDVFDDPTTWPRARRLDALALALVDGDVSLPQGSETAAIYLLDRLASYRQAALAAYAEARPLFERALAFNEKARGSEHISTGTSLNNLARLLRDQGELAAARPLFERSLAIYEKAFGEHPTTAACLDNLAALLRDLGDLAAARSLLERALDIKGKVLGPQHRETATSLTNLAGLLRIQRDLAAARPLYERAMAICQEVLGPQHPQTATVLNNLALLLRDQGDLEGARPLFERALSICEKVLGPEHPNTAQVRANLGLLLQEQSQPLDALRLFNAALAANDKVLGGDHPSTKASAGLTADALDALGRGEEAAALRKRYGIEDGGKPR